MLPKNNSRTSQLRNEFSNNVFKHVDIQPETLQSLLQFVREIEYPRKSFVLSAGETWDRLFYIHKGFIRLFYADKEGREFNKAFFVEKQCIWPVAPIDRDQGILFNIAAIEDSTLLVCPFAHLYNFLIEMGEWERFALPFAEKLVEQKFHREHNFLLLSATERLDNLSKSAPHILNRLPDYHLASFLGITKVSLSRIKKQLMQSKQLIENS